MQLDSEHWVEYGMVSHKHCLTSEVQSLQTETGHHFLEVLSKTSEISFQLSLDERTTVFMGYVRPICQGSLMDCGIFRPQRLQTGGIFPDLGMFCCFVLVWNQNQHVESVEST